MAGVAAQSFTVDIKLCLRLKNKEYCVFLRTLGAKIIQHCGILVSCATSPAVRESLKAQTVAVPHSVILGYSFIFHF